MAHDVYAEIPILENDNFLLRRIDDKADAEDLLKVYSDEKSVPFFNSDNCNGDTFFYKTIEEMKKAIDFWRFAYEHKYFVRWAIVHKSDNEAIGTIELFNRTSDDYFNNCGLLRLDLRSDHETVESIDSILSIIIPVVKDLFACDKIATKAVPDAKHRISVLEQMGFHLTDELLTGHDGTKYEFYYVKEV